MENVRRKGLLAALCVSAATLLVTACGGGSGDGYGGGGSGNNGGGGNNGSPPPAAPAPAPKLTESRSTPLALSADGEYLWSVNPDNDSVSVIWVAGDKNQKIAEVPVGEEPRCIAITPDDKKVYVANAVSGNISVIDAANYYVTKNIAVGTEPTGCALTLDGAKLYVANLSSDSVSVISTQTDSVTKTITGVGAKPRGLAVAEVGGQSKLYVTQFLAQLTDDPRTIDQKEGRDDGREGRVTVIDAGSDTLLRTIKLAAKATGFKSDGSTLDKIVFDATNAATKVDTLAFPNLLESIVIRGNRAYVPNTASSPNGPVKFNVNLQAFVSVIDIESDQEASGETFNMNKGINFEAVGKKLFVTNPAALAFKHAGRFEGFVLSRATDRLVRLVLDAGGKPTINAPADANDPGNVVRIEVGAEFGETRNSSPEGVVINRSDTRAYVMNLVSRDVSVIDISGNDPAQYKEMARIQSAALPTDAFSQQVLRGKELFNTSIGPEGTNDNARKPAGRMSDFGWGSCYGCHPRGLTDGVTWMFGDGPRQTVSMESTTTRGQVPQIDVNVNGNFAPLLPVFHQRVLNWSSVRDEIQDFELNIRNVSGGQGLIALADASLPGGRGAVDKCVFNLRFVESADCPAARATEAAITTGRDRDLDAIAAYIAFGIRAPVTAIKATDPDVVQGRALFAAANCQGCHGGANWTASTLDFTPPPAATEINAGQLSRFLCKAGTFDAALANELKGGGVAGQVNTAGANGGLGINIPSLLSVFASAPYFHSGSARTLDEVLDNTQHRTLGTAGVDTLSNSADRAKVAKFVASIDSTTLAFPEQTMDAARALCLQ
jgi:YVTN family beta-propeller protein